MKATVLKTLSDYKLVWVFDNQHRESACELKMSRAVTVIPGNLSSTSFIDQDDTRWIIDYKTKPTTARAE